MMAEIMRNTVPGTMLGSRTVQEHQVYAAFGEEGFHRLIAAFYRQIPNDDVLGRIYPKDDLEGAEERLRDFLIFRFGGPERYIAKRGHPRLRMRHAPFPVDKVARDRWMALMRNALDETGVPGDVRQVLLSYFESTATAMMNQG
jgi:hemoglobin